MASSIVTLYALHPTITKMSINLFYCMEINPGEEWLFSDLEIKCWDRDHLMWTYLGVFSILIWVVGVPLKGYFYLRENQKQLMEPSFFSKYKMIY